MNADTVTLVVGVVALAVFLLVLVIGLSILRLWLQAALTGTPVSIRDIIRLRLRNCPPQLIVHATIALRQRGVDATVRDVEGCYLVSVKSGRPITIPSDLADHVEQVIRNLPS